MKSKFTEREKKQQHQMQWYVIPISSYAQKFQKNKKSVVLSNQLTLCTTGAPVFGSVLLLSVKSITLPMSLHRTLLCLFVVTLSKVCAKKRWIPNPSCANNKTQYRKKDLTAILQ